MHSSRAMKMFPGAAMGEGVGATVSIRLIVFMPGLVYHCMLVAMRHRIHLVTSLDFDAGGDDDTVVMVMILHDAGRTDATAGGRQGEVGAMEQVKEIDRRAISSSDCLYCHTFQLHI